MKPAIDDIVQETRLDNKERILNICKYKDGKKLELIYSKGDSKHAMVSNCDKNKIRLGDIHTHPTGEYDVGITPSANDLTVNLYMSNINRIKQLSCITSGHSKNIHCIEPKKMPDKQKVLNYNDSAMRSRGIEMDNYVIENAPKDFNHLWFDKESLNHVKPSPKEIVDDALGDSNEHIRKNMMDTNKEYFCRKLIQGLNKPNDNRVYTACMSELKRRRLLGFFEY